jgi:hypothetical protein
MRMFLVALALVWMAGATSGQTGAQTADATHSVHAAAGASQTQARRGRAHHRRMAQNRAAPDAGKQPETLKGQSGGATDPYKACIDIWDSGTHMTKAQWVRACERVANRLNDLRPDEPARKGSSPATSRPPTQGL